MIYLNSIKSGIKIKLILWNILGLESTCYLILLRSFNHELLLICTKNRIEYSSLYPANFCGTSTVPPIAQIQEGWFVFRSGCMAMTNRRGVIFSGQDNWILLLSLILATPSSQFISFLLPFSCTSHLAAPYNNRSRWKEACTCLCVHQFITLDGA